MKEFKLKTNETLQVSIPIKQDAEAIIDYIKIVADESHYMSFSTDEFTVTTEQQEKVIETHKNKENQLMLKAEINGKIVGLLSFHSTHKRRGKHCGEFGVSVKKNHWGIGIGTIIITEMINWAKESGVIKKIDLTVQEDNLSALELYEKLGFEREGVRRRGSFENNRFYDLILMGMVL